MNINSSMPLMKPTHVDFREDGTAVVNMRIPTAKGKEREVNGVIQELATEKRGELLSLLQDMSISPDDSSVHIDKSELRFKAKVGELATTAARRLKAGVGVAALVTGALLYAGL